MICIGETAIVLMLLKYGADPNRPGWRKRGRKKGEASYDGDMRRIALTLLPPLVETHDDDQYHDQDQDQDPDHTNNKTTTGLFPRLSPSPGLQGNDDNSVITLSTAASEEASFRDRFADGDEGSGMDAASAAAAAAHEWIMEPPLHAAARSRGSGQLTILNALIEAQANPFAMAQPSHNDDVNAFITGNLSMYKVETMAAVSAESGAAAAVTGADTGGPPGEHQVMGAVDTQSLVSDRDTTPVYASSIASSKTVARRLEDFQLARMSTLLNH